MGSIGRIFRRSSQDPRQGIVEDGIEHGLEIARVVDEKAIWVEHSITVVILALGPYCARNELGLKDEVQKVRWPTLFRLEFGGVANLATIWPVTW